MRYKVLDHTGKEIVSSKMLKYSEEGFAEQGNDFAIVHQPQEKNPEDAPY